MIKKIILTILFVSLALSLVACSGSSLSSSGQTTGQLTTQSGASVTSSGVSDVTKLAAGTLKLEGTNLAVTAEEAKNLLPLWKAEKALGSSDTISKEELQALYDQIQETMTGEQRQAIAKMDLSSAGLASLLKDLGINSGGAGGLGSQTLSSEERSTRIAQFQSQNPGGGPGGMPPDGGMGGFMPPGGGSMDSTTSRNVQKTAVAGQSGTVQSARMDSMFIDLLIKKLKERAGS